MLAWAPFVPAVTAPHVKRFSVSAAASVTRVPGVSAYTVTVAPDATATTRSRAVLLRFRLIAAARLVALLVLEPDTAKSRPVFVVNDAVRVRVTAVPPVGVMVIDVVWPDVGSPVKVPTTSARVFPVDALTGNIAKSAVQLGVALTLKEYLAGHIPCATPPPPSEMAQSFFMDCPECLRGIGVGRQRTGSGRTGSGRTRPEPSGAFPCRSHWA